MIQISTCVHQQNPEVLEWWLRGIANLDTDGLDVCYSFILHNPLGYETELMARYLPGVELEEVVTESAPAKRGEYTHLWGGDTVETVAEAKNCLIKKAIERGADILFCDSDQIMQPATLKILVGHDKDICGEILWTRWKPREAERPNAWDFADYILSSETIKALKEAALVRVGYIGGLLLIKHHVLKAGVDYSPVPNLTFWGEDRHLGVRAAVLGFEMWVDTQYPAFHIYRDEQLEQLPDWAKALEGTSG